MALSKQKGKIVHLDPISHISAPKYSGVGPMIAHIARPQQTSDRYFGAWLISLDGPAFLDLVVLDTVHEIKNL